MIYKQIIKKNFLETSIVCILNIASLLIVALPVISYGILYHSTDRMSWINGAMSSGQVEVKKFSLGSGQIVYIEADDSFINSSPLNKNSKEAAGDSFCYIGVGNKASEEIKGIAQKNSCSGTIDKELLPDERSVYVITKSNKTQAQNAISEQGTSLDYTAVYLLLVYSILIGTPVLITYYNLTKLFDRKWSLVNRNLYDRGFGVRDRIKLTMAPTILGLLLSLPICTPFVFGMSKLAENVIWEGKGFLSSDSLYGFYLGIFACVFLTSVAATVIALRRSSVSQ